jgi:hypothetical protein
MLWGATRHGHRMDKGSHTRKAMSCMSATQTVRGRKNSSPHMGPVRWPRWSPRGSVLRFSVGNPGGWTSIEEVSADGSRPHALLPGWKGVYCCGNWTPDGKYYVFQSTFNWRTDTWAIRERSGFLERGNPEPVQLTAGPMDFQSPRRAGYRRQEQTQSLKGSLRGWPTRAG